ncbi:hypothetical protein VP01_4675g1 [Puccinia sorghi]|uniref:Uncharacterized protein n=1 Tax=Puccinia sorghi TaxID=27349 RepID=A0A0L6UN60_9BASI|nr:hypothetical protein VP01_4675g1 [Puccinia sorghi]
MQKILSNKSQNGGVGVRPPFPRSCSSKPLNFFVNYNRWTSCIISFSHDFTILHAVLNDPGSWHYLKIAKRIYFKIIQNTPLGYLSLQWEGRSMMHVIDSRIL